MPSPPAAMKSRWSRDSALMAPPIPITSSGRPHLAPLRERPRESEASRSANAVISATPAPAGKQANFVAQGLFEVDDVAVFDSAPAGLRDIKVKGRIVQRL